MSSIKLTADSGGGTFEIKAPSSSGNTRVLTLPDTGNLTLGATGILQVKSTTKKDGYAATSPQGSFTDITGLSVDITPTSTNNKILIFAHVHIAVGSSYGGQVIRFAKTVSGSTDNTFAAADADGNRMRGTIKALGSGSNDREYPIAHGMMHLDTPASTATHTYKLQHGDGDNTNQIYINMSSLDTNLSGYAKLISNITVMEIAQGVL
jgi:hypothetical protein